VPPALSDFLKSQDGMENVRTPNETKKSKLTKQPRDVLLYTAFFGFVNHPNPFGALKPKLWLITRFNDVRAAIRLAFCFSPLLFELKFVSLIFQ